MLQLRIRRLYISRLWIWTSAGQGGNGGQKCFDCHNYGHRKFECPNEKVIQLPVTCLATLDLEISWSEWE